MGLKPRMTAITPRSFDSSEGLQLSMGIPLSAQVERLSGELFFFIAPAEESCTQGGKYPSSARPRAKRCMTWLTHRGTNWVPPPDSWPLGDGARPGDRHRSAEERTVGIYLGSRAMELIDRHMHDVTEHAAWPGSC